MFAYGGISHIGLILIGVSQTNQTAFAGSMFYLMIDAIMQAGLFFIAGAAILYHGARTVNDLSRLRRSPLLVAAFITLALSMIGIPPTGGFFGKWHIILGCLEAGNYLAVTAIVVSTLLTMAYFQRLFLSMFGHRDVVPDSAAGAVAPSIKLAVGLTASLVVVLGLCSEPLIAIFRKTAAVVGL